MKYNWWIDGDSVVVLSLFAVASILCRNFVLGFCLVLRLGILMSFLVYQSSC